MKIGICHYRIGKTDGVSLEIIKRHKILKEMGHDVKLIAGIRHLNADYSIPELEYENNAVRKVKENAFFELKDFKSGEELLREVNRIAVHIEHQILKIQEREQFDVLFLHNIFSHVLHIPAAQAFYEFAQKTGTSIIGVHHDFFWDGTNAQRYLPTCKHIEEFLEKYVPPELPNLQHVTINTLNQVELERRRGIESTVMADTFDFDQSAWKKDEYNATLLEDVGVKENDVLILQATRVVDRKAIELAIDLTAELSKRKDELVEKELYNGKRITKDSDIVLVLAGYTEDFAQEYRSRLKHLIQRTGIKAVFMDDYVNTWRAERDGKKLYSLWDAYVYADLITYPSIWEGWGNQFIEAIFARKPIIIFEYPVFKSDIKPEGYHVISLGDALDDDRPNRLVKIPSAHLEAATSQAITTLTDLNTEKFMDENFAIGKKNHDDGVLLNRIQEMLDKAVKK